MEQYYSLLRAALITAEFLSAIIALIYLFRMNWSYWSWFCIYLLFIFSQELYWFFNRSLFDVTAQTYYALIGIPVQYLFLFWLFALKSLKNKALFLSCTFIYLSTYIPVEIYYKKIDTIYSLNLTTGTFILLVLIILEFIKQIKSDDILKFRENRMFYITIGVILFFIGTYPFFAFYDILHGETYHKIWEMYYLYFIISNCCMYTLFAISLIWGKTR